MFLDEINKQTKRNKHKKKETKTKANIEYSDKKVFKEALRLN